MTALPKPDPRAKAPHPDDFAAWCEHPVTRFVATAYQAAAAEQREAWMRLSWHMSPVDPIELDHQRRAYCVTADTYNAFLETGLDDYVAFTEKP